MVVPTGWSMSAASESAKYCHRVPVLGMKNFSTSAKRASRTVFPVTKG
jgi:hypothetical protein